MPYSCTNTNNKSKNKNNDTDKAILLSLNAFVPELKSIFCLSSSSLLIFSRSSVFMVSNSKDCSFCNTRRHLTAFNLCMVVCVCVRMRVCVCVLLPPGAVLPPEVRTRVCGGWPSDTALCAPLQQQIIVTTFTFCNPLSYIRMKITIRVVINNARQLRNHTHRPLVSESACCSAVLPEALCILGPGPPAPPPTSPSPGSAAHRTTYKQRTGSVLAFRLRTII